jgi:Family of unknown function (DUF5683)
MKKIGLIVWFIGFLLAGQRVYAQKDSTAIEGKSPLSIGDSAHKHSPRKATIRSAILPGWGQAYNKKYWKIPIVYAALGITAYIFVDNVHTYQDVQFAYEVVVGKDTASYEQVPDYLKELVRRGDVNSLDRYRREFRKNIDYSVLIFLLFWGLNVIDATVDAHLKDFDVSPNISMKLKPMLPAMGAGFSGPSGAGTGVSLVFDIHKAKSSRIVVR